MSDNPLKPRSGAITDGPSRAPARAMLKAVGFTDADLKKPIIGVANTWIEIGPCNFHLRTLADEMGRGLLNSQSSISAHCFAHWHLNCFSIIAGMLTRAHTDSVVLIHLLGPGRYPITTVCGKSGTMSQPASRIGLEQMHQLLIASTFLAMVLVPALVTAHSSTKVEKPRS